MEVITKQQKYFEEILKSSYREHLAQFQRNFAQNILGWRKFKFIQMKDHTFFQWDILESF